MIKHTNNLGRRSPEPFLCFPSNDVYSNPSTSIADLPEDAKVLDVNEVINLDASQIQMETTGAQIVKEIQERLLSKEVPEEMAVLPEDTTQRLLVEVSMFYCFLFLLHPLFVMQTYS